MALLASQPFDCCVCVCDFGVLQRKRMKLMNLGEGRVWGFGEVFKREDGV